MSHRVGRVAIARRVLCVAQAARQQVGYAHQLRQNSREEAEESIKMGQATQAQQSQEFR